MPGLRIGVPNFRVLFDGIVLIVLRIDNHSKQDQIAAQKFGETLLQFSEVTGQAKAISRIRTAHVGETQGHDFPLQLRKRYFVPSLVSERKVWHDLLWIENSGRGRGIRKLADNRKPPGFQWLL